MISPDDARNAIEFKDFYIIQPQFDWWRCDYDGYRYVEEGFSYTSDKNTDFLSPEQMRVLIDEHMKLLEKVQYDYKSGENSTDNKKL